MALRSRGTVKACFLLHETHVHLDKILEDVGLFEYGRQAGYLLQLYKVFISNLVHIDLNVPVTDAVLEPVLDAAKSHIMNIWARLFHGDMHSDTYAVAHADIKAIINLVKMHVQQPISPGDVSVTLVTASLLEFVGEQLKPQNLTINPEEHAWYAFRKDLWLKNHYVYRMVGYWPTLQEIQNPIAGRCYYAASKVYEAGLRSAEVADYAAVSGLVIKAEYNPEDVAVAYDSKASSGQQCHKCSADLGMVRSAWQVRNCLHTFCEDCLQQHIDIPANGPDETIDCPVCGGSLGKERGYYIKACTSCDGTVAENGGAESELTWWLHHFWPNDDAFIQAP